MRLCVTVTEILLYCSVITLLLPVTISHPLATRTEQTQQDIGPLRHSARCSLGCAVNFSPLSGSQLKATGELCHFWHVTDMDKFDKRLLNGKK